MPSRDGSYWHPAAFVVRFPEVSTQTYTAVGLVLVKEGKHLKVPGAKAFGTAPNAVPKVSCPLILIDPCRYTRLVVVSCEYIAGYVSVVAPCKGVIFVNVGAEPDFCAVAAVS